MISIDKKEVEALEIIGQGASGSVYRYDEGRVLKLYKKAWSKQMVLSALDIAKSVYSGGVTTAKPYEPVTSAGQYGIIFEMLAGESLVKYIGGDIDKRYKAAEQMGSLLKSVHALKTDKGVFPPLESMFGGILGTVCEFFEDDEVSDFVSFVHNIPGSCCVLHGDFHENNIMVCGDKFYLIDLDGMCMGSPIFDLMQTYCTYRTPIPEEYRRYMNLTDEALDEFLLRFLGAYFESEDKKLLAHYDRIFTKASSFMRFFAPLYMRKESDDELRRYVELNIDSIYALMDEIKGDFKEIKW